MSPSKETWSEMVKPLLEELRRMVRISDLSQRKVEEKVGFSKGYLSQLLGSNLDLKMHHVFAILSALDVTPGEFFAHVFPTRPKTGSKPSSLADFRARSQPLDGEIDQWSRNLYPDRTEELQQLRLRLELCEEALGRLHEKGLVHFERPGERPAERPSEPSRPSEDS